MALLDLLGRRWALRILWELRDEPATTFRDLQVRCGDVSSSVLNQRLRELRGGGIIAIGDPNGYQLTDQGRDLLGALAPIDEWATHWGVRRAGPDAWGEQAEPRTSTCPSRPGDQKRRSPLPSDT